MANGTPTAGGEGTNKWDALIALIVCGGLVGLVVYLVNEYGDDTEKIAGILGIAAPVLAAAFGVSLGYYSGKTKGEATGKKKGKQELAAQLEPTMSGLEQSLTGGGAEAGTTSTARERLAELRGVVSGAAE